MIFVIHIWGDFYSSIVIYIILLLYFVSRTLNHRRIARSRLFFFRRMLKNKYHAFSRQSLFILLCFILITCIVKKLCCRFMLPKSSLSFIACDNRNKKDRGCNLYSKSLIAIANDFIHGKIIYNIKMKLNSIILKIILNQKKTYNFWLS